MIYTSEFSSPLGTMMIASDGTHLKGLWLEGQKYFAATVKEEQMKQEDLPVSGKIKEWLESYFAGGKPAISELPLAPEGGEFRKIVWQFLCEIPYGEVTTYGAVAKKAAAELGRETMSSQAVGGAVGHNPISIIIPCHRVVGTNSSLTGYAGGIDKKIWLLKHEGVDISRFSVPKKGSAL